MRRPDHIAVLQAIVLLVVAAAVATIVWAVRADAGWGERCTAAGGHRERTGTTYILSGKTLVPVAHYRCAAPDGSTVQL